MIQLRINRQAHRATFLELASGAEDLPLAEALAGDPAAAIRETADPDALVPLAEDPSPA